MLINVGHVEAIFRYPVKSMRGEQLEHAQLGWHGIEGDRRLAVRRVNEHSGFPWLTASKLPELLLYTPARRTDGDHDEIPTHVRTPEGIELPVFGEELAADIGRRCGAPVEMLQMRHGIFDDATVSVITSDTVREIGQLTGLAPDVRRFRPNILVRLQLPAAFKESDWLAGVLSFGEGEDAPAIALTQRDIRCSVINFDPDSARSTPEILKTVVRANENVAGVYGTVTRTGPISVYQPIFLRAATGAAVAG
jgi:uncharacterized protein YcbX